MRMLISRVLLALLVPALAAAQANAPAQPKPPPRTRVAVLDLRPIGVEATKAELLSEIALSEAAALPYLEVIGRSDIQAMLGFEKQRKMLGCEEDSACIAEIGGALGVKLILVGSVGKIGNLYRLDLKVLDTAKAGSVRRFGLNVEGAEEKMVAGVQTAVRSLFANEAAVAQAAGVSAARPGAQPVPASTRPPPVGTAVTQGTPQVPAAGASHKKVLLGLRLAYGKPGGDLEQDFGMAEQVETVGLFQLEGAFRLSERFSFGAHLAYGTGSPGSGWTNLCDADGITCTNTLVRLALDAAYDLAGPQATFVPWLGAGIGFEMLDFTVEGSGGANISFSASGWMPLMLQAGADLRLGFLRVGPYVGLSLAKYSQAEFDFTDVGGDAGKGEYAGKAHTLLSVGLRAGLEL